MFSLMGNCISCIRRKRQPERPVTLAILGLDSAGKTTTTKAFLGDNLETAPTVGFNQENFTYANYAIVLYDLGGGQKIRDIWKDYLNEIYGIIYVVDSSARERTLEVRDNLSNLLGHEMVKEKPLLVLANKEDIKGHMDEVEIMEKLQLEELVNVNKCPSKMVMCSAIKGTGKKMDPNLRVGMDWLCGTLDQMFDTIKVRVDHDTEIMEQKRQKEKEERRERVRKQREERERLEEEENKRLGIKKEEEEEDDDDIIVDGGDPFRRLDSAEMQRKEEKYRLAKEKEKEKKRRLKELQEQENVNPGFISENTTTLNNKNNEDDDGLHVPRSSRSLGSYGLFNGGLSRRKGSDDEGDSDAMAPRSGRQLLPPLQSPLGTKFMEGNSNNPKETKKKKKKQKQKGSKIDENEEIPSDNHVYGIDNYGQSTMSVSKIDVLSKQDDSENSDKNVDGKDKYFMDSTPLPTDKGQKKRGKSRSQNLDDEDGFDTLRLSQHLDDDEDSRSGRSITPIQKSSNIVSNDYSTGRSQTPIKKLKKKNRHLRKNKLAPSDDEFELSDVGQSPKKEALPWARSTSPKLNTIEDTQEKGRWGFADELTTVDDVQPLRRSRPNYDSDDLIL